MSKIDGISEMICLAYHDKFESKTPIEQEIIRVWATSIMEYLNVKDA